MSSVLIIDDDQAIGRMLSDLVKRMGHEARCALTLSEGLREAGENDYDVVFLDVNLPDGSGLEALPEIVRASSSPEVIIMTGYGDPDGAQIAIESGAWDYIQKPLSPKKIMLPLTRVFQYRDNLRRRPPMTLKLEGIIGGSPRMKACYDLVAQAARSEANVLLTGETGTGKELLARAIHRNSARAQQALVVVDCAALPETLIESSLFGHERGAFTGADRAKEGLVKQADKGTLFLDELGELPLSMQKAFLRVLQERCFRPMGAKREVKSDFRLIAATNRNLDRMVEEGLFRKDLLFRVRSIHIEPPPLREHAEDIGELVFYHVGRLCERYGVEAKGFSPDFIEALSAYDWPGNARELLGVLDRTLSLARHEPILFSKHLPNQIRARLVRSTIAGSCSGEKPGEHSKPTTQRSGARSCGAAPLPCYKDYRRSVLREAERKYFQDLMETTRGCIKDACEMAGLGRTQLYILLKKHGISRFGW